MTEIGKKGFNKKLGQTVVIRAQSNKHCLYSSSPFYPLPLYPFPQPFLNKFCAVPHPPSNTPNPLVPPASPLLSVANSRFVLSKALPVSSWWPINL